MQAGQNIQCSCGKTLTVPTMHGLRQLEQAVDTSEVSRTGSSYGGAALGLALLGLAILAAGGILMYRTYAQWPVLFDVAYMSPWQTWLEWQQSQRA